MNQTTSLYTRFKELNACVLIPTYNNGASLPAVIDDVAQYTNQVIVVNDGSTDNTASQLQNFPWLQVKVVIPVAFFTYSESTLVTSIETEGFDPFVISIPKTPVLISAAIEITAKYVELKGF